MPEGDTLHRTAMTLSKALAGQTLVRVASPLARIDGAGLAGHKVESVGAMGENLVIVFDDGRMLHTHLRMQGSWHIYRPHEHWRRPVRQMRVVLDVGDIVAVCFNAPTVRLVRGRSVKSDPHLAGLGPDVVADDFDDAEALRRLSRLTRAPLGDAIVDQTALSGIGNIYKSETLFLCRADPFAPVSSYGSERLASVIAEARNLMRANVAPGRPIRTIHTGPGGRYWVYRRENRPCRRCQTPIEMRRQGTLARSTYYCRSCQNIAELGALARRQ